MGSWNRQVDNGSLEMKLLLRSRLLQDLETPVAVDLFAGRGRVLAGLGKRFGEIHAVEQDPRKAQDLGANLAGLPNVSIHRMDNRAFIRERLPAIPHVAFIDLDAYGSPNRAIKLLFEHWRPGGPAALAVTDGSRLALTRGQRVRLADFQAGVETERDRDQARLTIPHADHYELMVRTFWNDLAAPRGLVIRDFMGLWKKARMVYYYGLVIEPD